jgi:NAD(P)-dependent dehydrogenase (short-subunit alcohol dehydrogenase family)
MLASQRQTRFSALVSDAFLAPRPRLTSPADEEDPAEPELNVLNINGIGALYTVKLALHYFRRQTAANKGGAKDQLLVLQGSLAGYLDLPGAVQYGFTKFGLRSVMRNLRQTEYNHGIRVNYIGPWWVVF